MTKQLLRSLMGALIALTLSFFVARAADPSFPIITLTPQSNTSGLVTNGQCLSTNTGLFCRINGVVVGPFGTATGSGRWDLLTSYLTQSSGNDTGTGTTTSRLAKIVSTGAVTLSTSDTSIANFLGVCVAGCANSGSGIFATQGTVPVDFDNATVAGDFVVASTITAGKVHDAGSTLPVGVNVFGFAVSTNAGGAGNYTMDINPVGVAGAVSAAGITATDGTHTVSPATTLSFGSGLLVGGSSPTPTINLSAPDVTKTANYAVAAADMGGQVNFNGTSLTATIPAISSTVLAAGMSVMIVNFNSSALTLSSTPTINGFSGTTVPQFGGIFCNSNGTSLDCVGLGASGGGSTITNSKTVVFDSTITATAQTVIFPIEWTTYTLTSFKAYGSAGSGTFTVALQINGTPVTSCNVVSVTADGSNHNTTCTAANTGSVNDRISVIVGAPSGTVTSPVYISPVFTHTVN